MRATGLLVGPRRARARRGPMPSRAIGVEAGSTVDPRAARPTAYARGCGAPTACIEATGSAPGGTRTAIFEPRLRDHDVARAVDRRGVEAEDRDRVARPHAVGDLARGRPARRRRARRPGAGSPPRAIPHRPSRRPLALRRRPLPASSWSVAIRRVRASRASGAAPPKCPECSAVDSVRSVTVSLPWPRRVSDSVGSPTFQLPLSATTITSARISSGVAARRPRAASGARSPPSPRSAP